MGDLIDMTKVKKTESRGSGKILKKVKSVESTDDTVVDLNKHKKFNTAIVDNIKRIAKEVYSDCMLNIKDTDNYSYIDLDILKVIDEKVKMLDVNVGMIMELCNRLQSLDGAYAQFFSGIDYDNIDYVDVIGTIVEDELTALILAEGYKVCFKVMDIEWDIIDGVSIYDGVYMEDLDAHNVFDRIIMSEILAIPYDVVYIK